MGTNTNKRNPVPDKGHPKRASALRDEVRAVLSRIETDYWRVGGYLIEIEEEKYWESWEDAKGNTYASFQDWVDGELNLGKKERTVRYWKATRRAFEAMGVEEEDLADIGWAKAKEIVRVAKKGSIRSWLRKAKNLCLRDLQAEVQAELGKGKEEVEETVFRSFRLFPDQAANLQAALDKAQTVYGDPERDPTTKRPDGLLLDMICLHYVYNGDGTREDNLIRDLRSMERVYGVKVVAVDDGKVIYGKRVVVEGE